MRVMTTCRTKCNVVPRGVTWSYVLQRGRLCCRSCDETAGDESLLDPEVLWNPVRSRVLDGIQFSTAGPGSKVVRAYVRIATLPVSVFESFQF
jgi:hypothetical protein